MHDLIECIKILDLSDEILEVLKRDRDSVDWDWQDDWDSFMLAMFIGDRRSKHVELMVEVQNHLVRLKKFLYPGTRSIPHELIDHDLRVELIFGST